jgi:hypothetical protein
MASMGPRFFSVDHGREGSGGGKGSAGFNGATLLQRGSPGESNRSLRRLSCFNGATLLQRGSPDLAQRCVVIKVKLQWGHASSAWITARSPTLCEVGH